MEGRVGARRWTGFALPVVILASVLLIYLPLPAPVLDFFLAANLGVSALILLTAVFVRSPLEFSLFPALLLVTTLARIALNVATTRLILARGPIDHELAAGYVVRGFGEFVANDYLAVGMVIFLILFLVQFLVITHGTTRIGEVAARFALDGLPGRQMAIDADLNAGLITHEQAQQMRRRLLDSADFYGSMDGSSKYIRGDALAGLCITAINLVGGIAFGISQGMTAGTAVETFSTLTIGDGLASQLPALLVSLAAGLLVSRGSADTNFSEGTFAQITGKPVALVMTAGLLGVFAFTNMPFLPLALLAGGMVTLALWTPKKEAGAAGSPFTSAPAAGPATSPGVDKSLGRLLETSPLQIELGAGLVSLANAAAGGTLLAGVGELRNELVVGLGLVLPKIRVIDNLQLAENGFRVLLDDHPVITARIEPDSLLRVAGAGGDIGEDSAGGFPWASEAVWVLSESYRPEPGELLLAPTDVILHCVEWVVRSNAAILLGRDTIQQLMDETRRTHPIVVQEYFDSGLTLADLQRVARALVSEGFPLRPLHQVLESILEIGAQQPGSQRPGADEVADHVRRTMGRNLCRLLREQDGRLACFGLSDELERRLYEMTSNTPFEKPPRAGISASLVRSVETGIRHMQRAGMRPVMLVRQDLRRTVAGLLQASIPVLTVLGDREIDATTRVDVIARIRLGDLQEVTASAA